MKSHGNLWPEITSFENLHAAFRHARVAKRARPDVAAFEFDLEGHLLALQQELLDGSYRPGGYRNFVLYEPARRKISAAPFRDRVVHHALCQVIAPLLERTFQPCSFANRRGYGTHRALDRCRRLVRRHRYVLKADITRFFPSVDHEILYALLAKRIRCRPTRALVRTILDSGAGILAEEYEMAWYPGDTLLSPLDRPRGLPIGNLTSQFWANVYLNELDRFVVRDLGWATAYIRYVDDFLLFADDKAVLHAARGRIAEFLVRLRLSLHPRKTRVLPVHTGVPFLGFVHTPRGARIPRESARRFVTRMRRYRRLVRTGELPVDRLSASVRSWMTHAAWGQTYRLRSALAADLAF